MDSLRDVLSASREAMKILPAPLQPISRGSIKREPIILAEASPHPLRLPCFDKGSLGNISHVKLFEITTDEESLDLIPVLFNLLLGR